MPFTLSHAAAALPFRRTRLDMSALVTGSFAPDFAYFFYLAPHGLFAHSWQGMFLVDLPLSLIALWLFHAYIKQPLSMLLPKGIRERLRPGENGFSFWPPARLALIAISILIGTATHILWDSFTHTFYWPYRHWSFLSKVIYLPVEGNTPMYKALQYGSTVFGIVVVAVWVWFWYRATKPAELPIAESYNRAQIRVITMVVPAVALCGGILRIYLNRATFPGASLRSMLHIGIDLFLTGTTLLALGLLVCGAVFRRRIAVTEQV
jgi:MFS family permease